MKNINSRALEGPIVYDFNGYCSECGLSLPHDFQVDCNCSGSKTEFVDYLTTVHRIPALLRDGNAERNNCSLAVL